MRERQRHDTKEGMVYSWNGCDGDEQRMEWDRRDGREVGFGNEVVRDLGRLDGRVWLDEGLEEGFGRNDGHEVEGEKERVHDSENRCGRNGRLRMVEYSLVTLRVRMFGKVWGLVEHRKGVLRHDG